MPLEREAHFVRRHAEPVIRHLDQLEPAGVEADADLSRAGVERIFNEFLKRARRPLDHLAGGDAIDELRRQPSY
jgi:hypothetical protein